MLRAFQGLAPRVHASAYVNELAYVVGDVEIGAYSSVPRGSFVVGVPGQVRGPLTEPQWTRLLHQGEGYVQLAKEYR